MKIATFWLVLLAALPCASVIWGSSVVWTGAFTGGGERTSVLSEK